MEDNQYPTHEELLAGLDYVRNAPKEGGTLELIVRRPSTGERETLSEGVLDNEFGLIGDNWRTRGSSKTADGSAHPDMQLNIMNARAAALFARDQKRWALAGDQLFVDVDLSPENLPAGTLLSIGEALIEITTMPHLGCKKFSARFGVEATKLANSDAGKALRMRGVNARVVRGGHVRVGDVLRKVSVNPTHSSE